VTGVQTCALPIYGGVFLSPGNLRITPDQLPEKVKDLLTNKTDKMVYIKSDARARYGVVEDVIDNVRAAGVDQIGLITELIPVKNPAQATPINAGSGQ
jgi:biopolymer transport protein ExbD/biopolymer transport protein TolR